ncbi:hypothetical protein JCM5350_004311 [Sporobolomyces pararoseus]
MQEDVSGASQVSSRSPTPQFARRANYQDYYYYPPPAAQAEGDGSPDPDYEPQQDEDPEHDQLGDDAMEQDELSEEESERGTTTAASRSRVGAAIPGLFDEDTILPEEEFGEMTIKELYTLMKAGVINLNPAYQRESVWADSKASGLIESIFRNAHIPELLFNIYDLEQATGDSSEAALPSPSKLSNPDAYPSNPTKADRDVEAKRCVWNCADGKQRCTSIRKFMDGAIPLSVKRKSDLRAKKIPFHALSPQERAIFEEKKVRFGFYRELSYPQECEIFKRVQLGVVLTKEEQNVSTSQYKVWITELIRHYAPTQNEAQLENLAAFAPRIIKLSARNRSLGVFLSLVSSLVTGYARASRSGRTTLDKLDEAPLPPLASRQTVLRILERFKRLSLVPQLPQDAKTDKWPPSTQVQGRPESRMAFPHRVWAIPKEQKGGKRMTRMLSPVEFMFIPLVIQKFESRRDGDLLEIIEQLRKHIDEAHENQIKDNSDVWNSLRAFMDNYDPDSQLKYLYNDDGSLVGNGPRQPPIEHPPLVPPNLHIPPAASTTSITSTNKGKRALAESTSSSSGFNSGSNGAASSSSSSSRKKQKTQDAEDAERKRQEAILAEEEKQRREAQAAEERRRKAEEERLRQEAEAKRIREEERKKREEERKRMVAEIQARRLQQEREIEEKSRREKEELEAADRARREKTEFEKSEIRRKEQEEIERLMSQDLDPEPVPEAYPIQAGSPPESTGQSKVQVTFEPTIFGFPSITRPEPSRPQHGSNTSQVSTPSISRQSSPPIAPSLSSTTARNGSQVSKPNSNSRSLPRRDSGETIETTITPSSKSNSKPSSSSSATSSSSKAKQKSKPNNNTTTSTNSTSHSSLSATSKSNPTAPPSEASAPVRIYSGAKARIAGSILAAAPPPAPAPTRRAPPVLPEQHPRQPERRYISIKSQAQQFDSRGRVVRPEPVQREEEDELEAYGGRGEDDIVIYKPQNHHIDEDNDRRRDLEVRALLGSSKSNNPVAVDPRDREVQNLIRLSGNGGHRNRNAESGSNRSTPTNPRNGNQSRLPSSPAMPNLVESLFDIIRGLSTIEFVFRNFFVLAAIAGAFIAFTYIQQRNPQVRRNVDQLKKKA